jgi:hypothetical protein
MAKYTVKVVVEKVEAAHAGEAEALVSAALPDDFGCDPSWEVYVVASDEPDEED